MSPSITEQSIEQLGGEASVLTRQRRDHAELDRLMNLYAEGSQPAQERQQTLQHIIQLTFSHAFAEETVLWPALRRLADDGEELTSRVEQEHQEINNLVADIERTRPADPRHVELVGRAFALIRQDIQDEEDLLLPRLQEALHHDPARLRRLGTTWETVRRTAPTHPHPSVPRRPPRNAVAGVPLSAFDRARDLFRAGTPTGGGRRIAVMTAALITAWFAARRARANRRHVAAFEQRRSSSPSPHAGRSAVARALAGSACGVRSLRGERRRWRPAARGRLMRLRRTVTLPG
ncbi:hemerythrin domain-containing protein [Streptomyces sp. PKU-EA00015]|uniref:hemerythrin domain-containing protein n=1 Tax=Streptomyces sp. PKU-EA00015 TaxID=2748326 RepID=UPI0015A4BDF4|nr:hemerythrin domain-containing protein [Streptomyces sp. PKU-EA00015]NWF25813.1 hemerythrin domain-containing protein [Streptomyces sp. PKU-EA00015]